MGIALTGANGFLGWHVRAALRETGTDASALAVGDELNQEMAARSVAGNRVIHLAGINRGSDSEVSDGNLRFANQVAQAVRAAAIPPKSIVFANSIQASNGSVYGVAKARAADILSRAAVDVGCEFVDVRLPNVFGEHGRPFYNAVTATFSHLLAQREEPVVAADKLLTLMHAQDAADVLIGAIALADASRLHIDETVSGLLMRLKAIAATYRRGEIPDLSSPFERDLFNTYRSYCFPAHAPIRLARHADDRGSFFELLRSHGGSGQSSFSTTAPGVTRGDHYHRRKVERFTVLSGRGVIRLRKLFTTNVVAFEVDGDKPVAIDMPTMWSHSIENVGADPLFTSFWTNDIFNPALPDTIPETVIT